MGYVAEPDRYRLRFGPGDRFAGLEVTCLGLTVGELLKLADMDRDLPASLRLLAGKIVEWNVERPDGTPVPVSYDDLLTLPDDLVLAIQRAWMDATSGVPDPLARSSTGGPPSVELSLPMEPLSASPAS